MKSEKDFHEAKCSGKLRFPNDGSEYTAEVGTILGPDTSGILYVVAAVDGFYDVVEAWCELWLRRVNINDLANAGRHMGTFGNAPRSRTEFDQHQAKTAGGVPVSKEVRQARVKAVGRLATTPYAQHLSPGRPHRITLTHQAKKALVRVRTHRTTEVTS